MDYQIMLEQADTGAWDCEVTEAGTSRVIQYSEFHATVWDAVAVAGHFLADAEARRRKESSAVTS